MEEFARSGAFERDVEQAITALKKGARLLRYGRNGKPKFCPFRLSNDEKTLIWFSGKRERQLDLTLVARIIPGQRTTNFQRCPCPEKEYQSFSLIYGYDEKSLDLVCKDKDQAELWFIGLKALISSGGLAKSRVDMKTEGGFLVDGSFPPAGLFGKNVNTGLAFLGSEISHQDSFSALHLPSDCGSPPQYGGERASSSSAYSIDSRKNYPDGNSIVGSRHSADSDGYMEHFKAPAKDSTGDAFRVSSSSVFSSSSQGSGHDENDALGDVYMWGEGIEDGILGGGSFRVGNSIGAKMDALLPKHLESAAVLDVQSISCGSRHAALVNRQGEAFCWGEESGGRLGHGVDADVPHAQLIEALSNMFTESVACGDYHTCAVAMNGELYTWGDGSRSFGLLGQGNDSSYWNPRKVFLPEGVRVSSVACGPWHTALVTSSGHLLTFGDGTFGALGHGDRLSLSTPREVDSLKGLKTIRAACGVWHTAAVVEVIMGYAGSSTGLSGKIFTWGVGDKGQLGNGDKEHRLVPTCVPGLVDYDFRQVACGHTLTVALTTSGQVYTMGSSAHGQLGNPQADGKLPCRVEGKLWEVAVDEISCGAYHVAVLTVKAEVYTWGMGRNGRLGHGDVLDRNTPTLVEALADKQVRSIACGATFTAAICLHKWISGADQSVCSGCKVSFGFTRKRHNCYNCGHAFCHACSSKKATKATLAPSPKKPYRVCDPCFVKLKVAAEAAAASQFASLKKNGILPQSTDVKESAKTELTPKFQLYDQSKQIEWSSYALMSPISRNPSPPPPAVTGNSGSTVQDSVLQQLKKTNKSLTEELLKMHGQIEALNQRCKSYEADLQIARNEADAFKATVAEEKSKCKAAKEVIKSLTAQLKDMAHKPPMQNNIYPNDETTHLPRLRTVNGPHTPAPTALQALGTDQLNAHSQKSKAQAQIPPASPRIDLRDFTSPEKFGTSHQMASASPRFPVGDNTNLRTVPASPRVPVSPQFPANPQVPASPRVPKAYGPGSSKVPLPTPQKMPSTQVSVRSINNSNTSSAMSENMMDPLKAKSSPSIDDRGSESPADTEWIEQHEPGVYITFGLLPGGAKDLKRVRFSRKKFTDRQAEEWWIENRQRVYKHYNVSGGNTNGDGMHMLGQTRDSIGS